MSRRSLSASINWWPTSKRALNRCLLDVRTKEEFDEVHIIGAQSVPLGEFKEFSRAFRATGLVVLY